MSAVGNTPRRCGSAHCPRPQATNTRRFRFGCVRNFREFRAFFCCRRCVSGVGRMPEKPRMATFAQRACAAGLRTACRPSYSSSIVETTRRCSRCRGNSQHKHGGGVCVPALFHSSSNAVHAGFVVVFAHTAFLSDRSTGQGAGCSLFAQLVAILAVLVGLNNRQCVGFPVTSHQTKQSITVARQTLLRSYFFIYLNIIFRK